MSFGAARLLGVAKTMAFRTDIKKKEIRIQKPAQSLTAFQTKVALGFDDRAVLMKRLLAAAAAIALALAAFAAWRLWRSRQMERHETALAALLAEVRDDRSKPGDPAEQAQKMRMALPRMEELAKTAPAPCAPVAEGLLAAWRLALGAEAPAAPGGAEGPKDPKDAKDPKDPKGPKDPWSRIRLAQRSIALGRAQEAHGLLSGLHKNAGPSQAWSGHYWSLLMQVRQLEGDRAQALKDYAEYRRLFRGHADAGALDKALGGV
jgi:predicted Zn-dependent protease